MKYIIIFIFIAVYLLFDLRLGYTSGSAWWTHITYMFQHAGPVHLLLNSLAFMGIFRALEPYYNRWFIVGVSIIISFACSYGSMYDLPTVGASSMIYALTGIYIAFTLLSSKVEITDRRKYGVYLLSLALCLAVSFFKQSSNFFLHVYCLFSGFCVLTIANVFVEKRRKHKRNTQFSR